MPIFPSGLPEVDRQTFSAGFSQSSDLWRNGVQALLLSLAGGPTGMAACRKDGRCQREPQKTLEEAIEAIITFSPDATAGALEQLHDRPPATQVLALLVSLAATPEFTPITIRRKELVSLLKGIREMQDQARTAIGAIEQLGKLNFGLSPSDLGPTLTLLSAVAENLRPLLR